MCGIKVEELVTVGTDKNDVHMHFIPYTTRFCDLCAERTAGGDEPACVKHCQARCMAFGDVAEMAKKMEATPRSSLYAPL
jgi:Fe-S-cluster-containing dehydrogenase component